MRRFVALLVLVLAALPSVFAQSSSWTVEALRLDGQPVAELSDVQRRYKGAEPFRRVSLQRGGTLPEGAEIAVPARGGVDLVSPNGNRIILYAGSRMVLLHASGKGERYQQGEGRVRFIVNKALDFFNVNTPERFLASVKGTEYEIDLAPGKTIEFKVQHGAIEVEQTGKVRIAKAANGETRDTDNIAEATLIKQGEQKSYDLSREQYLREFSTYKDAESYFRAALEAAEKSGDTPRIRRARRNLGWTLVDLSQYQSAIKVFEIELTDARNRIDELAESNALRALGVASSGMNAARKATEYYAQSLAVRKRLHREADHGEIAILYGSLGSAYTDMLENRKALEYLEHAMAMQKRLHGEKDNATTASIYISFGNVYKNLREPLESLKYYEQALAMIKHLYGERDTEAIATLYNNLGVAYSGIKQRRKAIEYYEQAAAIWNRLYGEIDHNRIASLYQNLGMAYDSVDEIRSAIGYYERALAIWKHRPGDMGVELRMENLYHFLALAHRRLNETGKAIENYEQALALSKRRYGDKEHDGTASIYRLLGGLHRSNGDHRRAIEYLEEGLGVRKRLYGENDHEGIAALYNDLGLAYQGLGDESKAAFYVKLAQEMRVRLAARKSQ